MTSSHRDIEPDSRHNSATVIGAARVRADIDTDLTVIRVSGEIDASNIDEVSRRVHGLVPEGGALIVDLAELDFIAIDGLRALFALRRQCARTDTTWTLIADDAVNRLLRVGDHEKLLPVVGSPTQAYDWFAAMRRRAHVQIRSATAACRHKALPIAAAVTTRVSGLRSGHG